MMSTTQFLSTGNLGWVDSCIETRSPSVAEGRTCHFEVIGLCGPAAGDDLERDTTVLFLVGV